MWSVLVFVVGIFENLEASVVKAVRWEFQHSAKTRNPHPIVRIEVAYVANAIQLESATLNVSDFLGGQSTPNIDTCYLRVESARHRCPIGLNNCVDGGIGREHRAFSIMSYRIPTCWRTASVVPTLTHVTVTTIA